MAPANILSLPLETTQEIGNLLPGGQKTLRLVCSQLNFAFEAGVLATLVILIIKDDLKPSTCQLETLASQKYRVSQLARTLKIRCLAPSHDPANPPDLDDVCDTENDPGMLVAVVKRHLGPAISSMKNLKRVVWNVNLHDPSWTKTIVIDALTGLPHLQDFELTLNGGAFPDRLLDRLSGLKKISLAGCCTKYRSHIINTLAEVIAKSPELVHLDVDCTYISHPSPEIPTLHELLAKVPEASPLRLTHLKLHGMCARVDSVTLPHLRFLVWLNLDLYAREPTDSELFDRTRGFSSTITDIYATLNREKVHLKQVVLMHVDDVILDYLSSYSGLEALELFFSDYDDAGKSDALSYRFYKSVLTEHLDSIQHLEIRQRFDGKWCYNVDNASVVLARCKKLKALYVSLASTSILESDEPTIDSSSYSHTCQDRNGCRCNLDDVISSLIDMLLSLPHLAQIHIFPSSPEDLRSPRCGVSRMWYHQRAIRSITRTLTNFISRDGKYSRRVVPDIWVAEHNVLGYKLCYADVP